MASVDSGVETGNESNDDPLDLKHDSHPEEMALVPLPSEPSPPEHSSGNLNDLKGERLCFELPWIKDKTLPWISDRNLHMTPCDSRGSRRFLDVVDIDTPKSLFPHFQPSRSPHFFPDIHMFYSSASESMKAPYPQECSLVRFKESPLYKSSLKMRSYFPKQRYMERFMELHAPITERKLRVAVSTNNIEKVQHLLFMGVNPNCYDSQRRAPLHLAACRGYADIVRLLLENGANPNQQDSLGNTPLHLAACTNNVVVVTLLLKAGTDVSSSDYSGRSPLQLAQSKLKLLRNHFSSDVHIHIKNQVYQVIEMMLEFLHKRGQETEAELLSAFSSRLTLSETKEQVETQVRDLLESLSGLSLDSGSKDNVTSTASTSSSSAAVGIAPEPPQGLPVKLPFQQHSSWTQMEPPVQP